MSVGQFAGLIRVPNLFHLYQIVRVIMMISQDAGARGEPRTQSIDQNSEFLVWSEFEISLIVSRTCRLNKVIRTRFLKNHLYLSSLQMMHVYLRRLKAHRRESSQSLFRVIQL
jgi:hypothetical protein